MMEQLLERIRLVAGMDHDLLTQISVERSEAKELLYTIKQLQEALVASLEWIDAVPKDTPLPTMPGFDRDMVDEVLYNVITTDYPWSTKHYM